VQRFVPSTPLGQLVADHRGELLAAAERRNVSDLRLFGSLARGEDALKSDVDLLVTLGPGSRPLDLLSFACDAEEILGVRVDVGTLENLRPEIRPTVVGDAVFL
jgi:predicted nucleotidyltransferase